MAPAVDTQLNQLFHTRFHHQQHEPVKEVLRGVEDQAGEHAEEQKAGLEEKERVNLFDCNTTRYCETWCSRCSRVDVVLYGGGVLPKDVKGSEFDDENAVVLIVCGKCRRNPSGRYQTSDISNMGDRCRTISLHPDLFEGGMAAEIARTLKGGETRFVTEGGGVAIRDINKIVTALTADDKVASVDVRRFKRGMRDKLLLPYLVGGLTS